jgi:hypothetical protein
MPSFHTVNIPVRHGENSQVFFAYDSPENVIIFVHGFNGEALGTWNDFPARLTTDPYFRKSDFFFYGYESLKHTAAYSATEFKNFVDAVNEPLFSGILPSSQKLPERVYKRFILVAHSLGSIVVRQALLMAHRNKDSWVNRTQMVLFAPAHKGARVQRLASELLDSWLGIIPFFVGYKYPVYTDLEPGSPIIKDIEIRSKELITQNKGDFTIAKVVAWAENDKVVEQVVFCNDPNPILIPNRGHSSVCKPNEAYKRPIEILKEVLK